MGDVAGQVCEKFGGWLGLLIAAVVGAVATVATLYFFMPVAPRLWLLLVVPLAIGALVAAFLSRFFARRAGVSRGAAAVVVAIVAMLPLGGLITTMLLSPQSPRIPPLVPDPRGPHRQLAVATGSSLAVWTLSPATPKHATSVVFLHGGPGSYNRNRDFVAGQGFRDAGFTTIYYDQAGSGASGNLPIADYTVARSVADLDALRVALGAPKIVLWGQSWGASLAAAYVRAHPDRVAATIVDSPGDFPGDIKDLDYSKADGGGDGIEPTLRDATLFALISFAPQLAEMWQSQAVTRETQEALAQRSHLTGFKCKGDPAVFKRPLSAGGGNLYPQLRLQSDLATQPKITAPISTAPALLVRGECDYLPLATAALYMAALPAAQRIDVPGRAHAFFGHEDELSAILGKYAATALATLP